MEWVVGLMVILFYGGVFLMNKLCFFNLTFDCLSLDYDSDIVSSYAHFKIHSNITKKTRSLRFKLYE